MLDIDASSGCRGLGRTAGRIATIVEGEREKEREDQSMERSRGNPRNMVDLHRM